MLTVRVLKGLILFLGVRALGVGTKPLLQPQTPKRVGIQGSGS